MPFGLKNAPSTFQRLMDSITTRIQNETCLVHRDDIIIFSVTLNDHINFLKEVFAGLKNASLKIQPDKCGFLSKEVAYFGHVTKYGVKPNSAKVANVPRFAQPQNQKQIKQSLFLTGYYRKFIANYSKIIKSLTNLLKKDTEFKCDKDCVEAFEKCKHLLTTTPILRYPNFEEEFILTTDASAFSRTNWKIANYVCIKNIKWP